MMPEEIARAIALLVPSGGDAISGSVVNVDAGHYIHRQPFPPKEMSGASGALLAEGRRS
jgi:hypothetical protein